MEIIRAKTTANPALRGAAAAIGNFDGVHLGHQKVIGLARDAAARLGAPLGVLTFEPHPRQFFSPNAPAFRLMNAEARANRLARLGVSCLYELPFDADLAALSAEAFARRILAKGLGLAHLVVGADFRFGKERAGDAEMLRSLGPELGFGVTIAALLGNGAGEISSTAIRRALSEGRTEDAARMLGHLHRIEGRVIRGERQGRKLGFPTANIPLDGLHQPRLGSYAARVEILSGPHAGMYLGAASCTRKPAYGGRDETQFEVHLFDFDGDIYGEQVSVGLVSFLRPDENFPSLEALIAQIGADCARARALLADG